MLGVGKLLQRFPLYLDFRTKKKKDEKQLAFCNLVSWFSTIGTKRVLCLL